jgi:hypothetical protein
VAVVYLSANGQWGRSVQYSVESHTQITYSSLTCNCVLSGMLIG